MDTPRNIEMRFSLQEAMTLHAALRARQADAEKEAWDASRHGEAVGAAKRQDEAAEHEALADRVMKTIQGLVATRT